MNSRTIATAILFLASLLQRPKRKSRFPRSFPITWCSSGDQPIPVWGNASPGETVTAAIGDTSVSTKANPSGKWALEIPALKSGGDPKQLTVSGTNTITFKDVLVGEVWLCSGQSNMNRPVSGDVIKTADHPEIRLFTTNGKIPRKDSLNDVVGWLRCTPENIAACGDTVREKRRAFSEVAFHFGKHLHEKLRVPVGIIHTSMGGSTAKDWTPNPNIATEFPFDKDHGDVRHKFGIVYQARLHGLIPFPLRGFVWYQGEDDGRNRKYADDLQTMISSWRELWGDEKLPFYMVQIAQTTYASGMLGVWEAQQQVTETVPNTGIAPSNDIYEGTTNGGFKMRTEKATGLPIAGGGNPHPTGRPTLARRAAEIALAKTYGVTEKEVFGPQFHSAKVDGDKMVVRFRHVGTGLKTSDGAPPNWFEISDGKRTDERDNSPIAYARATATITGSDTLEVRAEGISNPKHVRFSWHPLGRHNLVNSEGLPALPFRSDRLPQMWNRR